MAITLQQLHIVAAQTDGAYIALNNALDEVEGSGDLRFTAQIRSRMEDVRKLRDEARQRYLDLRDGS